jgi:flagellar hook-associated protein 3 FlgL
MLHEFAMAGVIKQQSLQLELQEQIASGRRVQKPSDDPVAAAAAVNLEQAKALNSQYGTNAANAESALALEEQALGDASRILQDVKTLSIQAGNAALQNNDRASLAGQIRGLYDELLGVSNRTDGNGSFLFSGYQGTTQPFSESAPGVVSYAGDEGRRLMQIGAQRRIAIGDSGAEVFQRVREGNGTFVTTAAGANTGTAVVGATTVRDGQAWANAANSRDYTVTFHIDAAAPPVTTYDIIDNVANLSMLTGLAPAAGPHARTYQSGAQISLARVASDPSAAAWNAGIEFGVTGAPASGDTLAIARSQNQDVFATIHELITTLEGGIAASPPSRAVFQNNLNRSGASVDRALDHMLTARSSVGSRMQELDSVRSTTSALDVNYEADLSRIQDLDHVKALSDLTRRQMGLEAAQKSYIAITRMSIFDFL